ncbi:polyamine aminopropyltransferase [Dyadobacter sp. UP-52]|uniref:Polyamine aminopropyltransferase n=1 Tax=Dyadobacter subterraneus TaxID=2773304 RepID=A0ABR9WGV6_9BACT|nr:polyamine aminopropyltransferase [Dyadobacter subterraneus]
MSIILKKNSSQWVLLLAVFIIATCGLIYELVAGTLASYLLGDSVTQFSIIIGVYLFSMGIGSYLSRFFNHYLIEWFIRVELLVGLVGGFSAALLFLVFPLAVSFQPILYAIVSVTGILVGIEIPLLLRILKDKVEFKELVSRVFTYDYIGALLASLIFPLLFVPYLGLIRTSLFFGLLNIGVGLYLCHYFSAEIRNVNRIRMGGIVILIAQIAAFIFSGNIMSFSETLAFNDQVVYSTSTPYQRIVITKNRRDLRLYLNNNLQFSSADEYRYHEALVHPAMMAANNPKNVLILGGGDGLAAREILKYNSVKSIQLVDLDPVMTKLFSTQKILSEINHHALTNSKVTVTNADAFVWLKENKKKFDCVIIDFPDPSGFSVGKLYTTAFYRLLKTAMTTNAVAVIQSTSPYVAPKSFWCVSETLKASGFNAVAYHNYVPSFGEWGYVMAMNSVSYQIPDTFNIEKRYISQAVMQQMLQFPEDMKAHEPLEINKLNNQALVTYFEQEWGKYLEQ